MNSKLTNYRIRKLTPIGTTLYAGTYGSSVWKYENATSVGEEQNVAQHSQISISPNPVSTSFTISGIEKASTLHLINNLGMEVGNFNTAIGTQEIDVSNFANGVYYLLVQTGLTKSAYKIVVYR